MDELGRVSPLQRSLVASVDQLNDQLAWFDDPQRSRDGGPWLIVVDDFYEDPDEVRRIGLSRDYVQYFPPLEDQVGPIANEPRYQDLAPSWFTTALLRYNGREVRSPYRGYRYNGPELMRRFAQLLNEEIVEDTWNSLGDWWNGAFHLINNQRRGDEGSVHHHYKDGDVYPRGWSGLVYLSPNAPSWSGTSIWRAKSSMKCVAHHGVKFYEGVSVEDNFELALLIENRYNRLVLFRENVLHRAEIGFGFGRFSRLTQTFFFRSEVRASDDCQSDAR